jgi:hypothetical protein
MSFCHFDDANISFLYLMTKEKVIIFAEFNYFMFWAQ